MFLLTKSPEHQQTSTGTVFTGFFPCMYAGFLNTGRHGDQDTADFLPSRGPNLKTGTALVRCGANWNLYLARLKIT